MLSVIGLKCPVEYDNLIFYHMRLSKAQIAWNGNLTFNDRPQRSRSLNFIGFISIAATSKSKVESICDLEEGFLLKVVVSSF